MARKIDYGNLMHRAMRSLITEVLRDVEGISFTFFNSRDVVRHPLVQRIVRAYEAREDAQENNKGSSP